MGSDFVPYRLLWKHWISIHAPRMGSDRKNNHGASHLLDFNPRSPHGERLLLCFLTQLVTIISIHAPRMGSDRYNELKPTIITTFQSTLPAWGATLEHHPSFQISFLISIHAPRMGSDKKTQRNAAGILDFNPRSPHGERPIDCIDYYMHL